MSFSYERVNLNEVAIAIHTYVSALKVVRSPSRQRFPPKRLARRSSARRIIKTRRLLQ